MTSQNPFIIRAAITAKRIYTFDVKRMQRMWNKLEAEDKHRWLFYDGHVTNDIDYITFMSNPEVYSYAVYDQQDETELATFFVNNFMGNTAMMHFSYLNAGLPYLRQIGLMTCDFLLSKGNIAALIGLTPKPFRHAWKFAMTVGFTPLGIVPQACALAHRNTMRIVDGVATICTPQTLLQAQQAARRNQ